MKILIQKDEWLAVYLFMSSREISLFYNVLISAFRKISLHRTYTIWIQYLYADQILLSNSSNSS